MPKKSTDKQSAILSPVGNTIMEADVAWRQINVASWAISVIRQSMFGCPQGLACGTRYLLAADSNLSL
jgi:hypothetical protein